MNDFYEYSIHSRIWYNISVNSFGQKPSPRYRLDSCVVNDRIYFFGGVDHIPKKYNTLYEYDIILKEWSLLDGLGDTPTPRSFLKMVSYEQKLVVFGGFDEKKRNDLSVYHINNRQRPKINRKQQALINIHDRTDVHNDNTHNKASVLLYRIITTYITITNYSMIK